MTFAIDAYIKVDAGAASTIASQPCLLVGTSDNGRGTASGIYTDLAQVRAHYSVLSPEYTFAKQYFSNNNDELIIATVDDTEVQPSTTLTYYNNGLQNTANGLLVATTPINGSLTASDFSVNSVVNGASSRVNVLSAINMFVYYTNLNQTFLANFYAGYYFLAVDLNTPNNTVEITHSVTVTATVGYPDTIGGIAPTATTLPWVYVQPYAAPQAPPSVMTLGADRVDNYPINNLNIRSFGGADEYISVTFNTDTRIEDDGVFTCRRDGIVVPFYGFSIEKYGSQYRKTSFISPEDVAQNGGEPRVVQYLTAPATITVFDDAGAFYQDNVHLFSVTVPVGDHIGTYTVSYSSSTTQIVDGITFTLTQ